jgi:hypothetical protein
MYLISPDNHKFNVHTYISLLIDLPFLRSKLTEAKIMLENQKKSLEKNLEKARKNDHLKKNKRFELDSDRYHDSNEKIVVGKLR